jgi:hypothetical protein
MNGIAWNPPERLVLVKRAVETRKPPSSKKAIRPPVTPEMMDALARAWSKGSNEQLCALAAAAAAWNGLLRLGEWFPASPSKLQLSRVPSTRHFAITNNSTLAASISLPWTKTTKSEGAQVTLAAQKGHRNPALHIANHIVASSLTEGDPLASYRDGQGIRTMTKSRFMKLCNDVWNIRDDSRMTGHSFRIGGATAFLRAGVPPDVVKKMGRWKSDAFLIYWRENDDIIHSHASNREFSS